MATNFLPKQLQNLIDEFSRLPGIGPKSAQRLAMHLLHSPHSRIKNFGDAVLGLKEGIEFCQTCWNLTEKDPCPICSDERRDRSKICVVEEVLDVVALERTGEFKGFYHVLHGALSPIDGIGPEDLKINELLKRITNADGLEEVILATNPSLEGEATAMYIHRALKSHDLKVTRIARGLPMGGDLDYADEMTLSKALQGRVLY